MTPSRPLARWLFICAAALCLITLVGAVTRITESGLSIVEWKPVTGALPPLSQADWAAEFARYQTSPQYKKVNADMDLAAFKNIYFWEWLHRLIGRGIGLIYALPLLVFWRRGMIPPAAKAPLLGILALGFAQGAMGWYMVKSGLVDQPAVSHYRLAAHLMLAVTIYCCLLRMGLLFARPWPPLPAALRAHARLAAGLVLLTMVWGAFVAGLRAGWIYNEGFPFMGAHLWPGELLHDMPWWINFFENHAAVQFTHRALAVLSFLVVGALSLRGRLPALGLAVCLQLGLGIATLLSHVEVVIATLHQGGALVVLGLLMLTLHRIEKHG